MSSRRLTFDFKGHVMPADCVYRKGEFAEHVYTGHADGKITINIQEADDVEREKLRVDMNEAHRTLIGHFRHEIGHYYWQALIQGQMKSECNAYSAITTTPTMHPHLRITINRGPGPIGMPGSSVLMPRLIHGKILLRRLPFTSTFARCLDTAAHLKMPLPLIIGDGGIRRICMPTKSSASL